MKKSILLAGLPLIVAGNQVSINAKEANDVKKVVFIAVDDLNDWVGFLNGHPSTLTPNLNKLASMGMVFNNAYCAAPVSNASRSALLTGYRTSTSGVYGNEEFLRDSPVLKDAITLPKWFSNNGYTSMSRGKIFHQPKGPKSDPQSWDDIDFLGGAGLNPHREPGKQANGLVTDTSGKSVMLDWAGVNVDEKLTNDYKNAEWAAKEVMEVSDEKKFIACGIFRPHLPWYVPQKYFDRLPLDSIPEPIYNEEDPLDLPARALQLTGYKKKGHEYNVIKEAGRQKEAIRAYLACIAYADDCLTPLVKALENNPDKENTVIVLWGDHGWHLGEKMRYRKVSLWERSAHVPLIIVAPGLTKGGERCSTPVSLMDLYPTLLELANLPANENNEGTSLLPQLINPNKKRKEPVLTTLNQNEHSLRSDRYRYIVYRNGEEELYDHKNDPNEYTNLAKDAKYQRIIKKMRKSLPTINVPSIAK